MMPLTAVNVLFMEIVSGTVPATAVLNGSCHLLQQHLAAFLGRLFNRVDLIKPVSNVHSSIRVCVRVKVSSTSVKFGM